MAEFWGNDGGWGKNVCGMKPDGDENLARLDSPAVDIGSDVGYGPRNADDDIG